MVRSYKTARATTTMASSDFPVLAHTLLFQNLLLPYTGFPTRFSSEKLPVGDRPDVPYIRGIVCASLMRRRKPPMLSSPSTLDAMDGRLRVMPFKAYRSSPD